MMTEQSTLDSSDPDVPTRKEVNERLGESYTQNTYAGYHKPLFEYLYSLDDSEQVRTDKLIEEIIDKGPKSSNERSTKIDKIRDILKVDPELNNKVGDRFPVGEVLVRQAKKRVGVSEEPGIPPEIITDAQKACEEVGEEAEMQILRFHAENLKTAAAAEADVDIDEEEGVSPEELDLLLAKFAEKAAEELPDEVESIKNSIRTNGGYANELLAVELLRGQGLSEGKDRDECDFWHCGSSEDEDLVVFSEDHDDLNVEVKSTNARERAARALVDIDDPTVLFAFLQDPKEVRNGILEGDSSDEDGDEDEDEEDLRRWPAESIAAYVPQATIDGVKEIDEANDQDVHEFENEYGRQYLRSCDEFPKDMIYYRENGKVRSLDTDSNSE